MPTLKQTKVDIRIHWPFIIDILPQLVTNILSARHLRKPLIKLLNLLVTRELGDIKPGEAEKKLDFLNALLENVTANVDKGWIKKPYINKVAHILIKGGFLEKEETCRAREIFRKKYSEFPPHFLVLSPTQQCNLNCSGCYAVSSRGAKASLPYVIVEKIADESYHKFGNRFMTISGGEPFLYRDGNKSLFDLWGKYHDMFFQVFTNGTCLTRAVTDRLAELGNITPGISVEGFASETELRRGKGMHGRILEAMANLRRSGVAFGISVTATRNNINLLLTDKFYDYYFKELGASYMWQFQLMPIGKDKDTKELMITPEERVKLYHKWEYIIKTKRYMVADFWNSAILSDGCIAYGRDKGYFYIDWNGHIMPCVFVPYYVDNVFDLYGRGKSLTEALFSDFFKNGRAWQNKYKFNHGHGRENFFMPCSIRDHYRNFKENIITADAKAENIEAAEALKSEDYLEVLDKFDDELEELTLPILEEFSGQNRAKDKSKLHNLKGALRQAFGLGKI